MVSQDIFVVPGIEGGRAALVLAGVDGNADRQSDAEFIAPVLSLYPFYLVNVERPPVLHYEVLLIVSLESKVDDQPARCRCLMRLARCMRWCKESTLAITGERNVVV